jgi:hypothetical protein
MIGAALATLMSGANRIPKTWDLTVQTTAVNQNYTVDIFAGTTPSILIDWGDGNSETFTTTGQKTKVYAAAGTYTVKISGSFASGGNIRLGSNGDNRARLKATRAVPRIPGLASFRETFLNCTGLTGSIPTDLFRYNTLVSTNGFQYTFSGCSGLTGSIPADLFRYNTLVSTSGFQSTFQNCTGLTGSIPASLFQYNTLVSTYGFYATFYGCTGLTGSIPADLFRYNTLASSNGFYATFFGCTGLTGPIPDGLFRYNIAVSSSGFISTFYLCTKLEPSPYIFFAAGEEGTRFLNRVSDFTNCFRLNTAYLGTNPGTAPALWACDFGSATPVKTDCFQGHSAPTLTNFADIPVEWT